MKNFILLALFSKLLVTQDDIEGKLDTRIVLCTNLSIQMNKLILG